MADDKVEVTFGAKIDELVSGMQDMSSAVQDQLSKMNDSLQGMSDQSKKAADDLKTYNEQVAASFKSLQTAVAASFAGIEASIASMTGGMKGLLGILAGGELFKGAVEGTIKWGEEVATLSRSLGVTTGAASTLNYALRLVGTDAGTYTSALMRLERQLKSNEDGLKALGMATRDANGHLVDGQTAMQNAISMIQQYKVGVNQGIVSTTAFGRGTQAIGPLMKLNADVMAHAEERVKQLGLRMSVDGINALRKYEESINDFKGVLLGIEVAIGNNVIPQLDHFAFYLNEVGPSAASATVEAIKVVVATLDAFNTALRASSAGIAAWAGTIYAGLTRLPGMVSSILDKMDLKGEEWGLLPPSVKNLPRAIEAINADIAAQQKGLSETIDAIWNDTGDKVYGAMKGAHDRIKGLYVGTPGELPKYGGYDQIFGVSGKGSAPTSATDKGGGAGGQDLLAQYGAELEKLKNSQSDLNAWSAAKDYEFWNTKLAAATQGSAEWQQIWNKMADMYRSMSAEQQRIVEKSAQDQIATAKLVADMQKNDAETAIKVQQEKLNAAVALDQMSASERAQAEMVLYDKEFTAALTAQYKELALIQQTGDASIAAQAKVYDQMEKLQNQHILKMQQTQNQYLAAEKKEWDGYADQVGNAMTSMLFHHQTMLQTIQGLTEKAIDWIITGLLHKLVDQWVMSEAQKTAATTAGVAQRAAAESAGASAGMLANVGTMLKSIMASAGETFAGVFGFLSPVMGPAAAGPAAASEAMVLSMASMVSASAAGGWDVPSNMSGLMQYHPREMMLPAPLADKVRNMTDQGGNVGRGAPEFHPHFHFSNDPKSFQQQLRDANGPLMKQIKEAFRDFQMRLR